MLCCSLVGIHSFISQLWGECLSRLVTIGNTVVCQKVTVLAALNRYIG